MLLKCTLLLLYATVVLAQRYEFQDNLQCWRGRLLHDKTRLRYKDDNLVGWDEDGVSKCQVQARSRGYYFFAVGKKGQCWATYAGVHKQHMKRKPCPPHGRGSYGVTTVYQIVSSTSTVNLSNWMSDIDDETQVGQLTVPGTHDTAANHLTPVLDWGQTQDLDIAEQLSNGIRFMDIRIADNLADDDFELRHGILLLGSFKKKAMEPTISFLDNFPEETVFMSIAPEGDTDTDRLVKDFITEPTYKFYQGPVTGQTKIKDIRGKIVLFNRYDRDNNDIGIGWNVISNAGRIQDNYQLEGNCDENGNCDGWLHGWNYTKKAEYMLNHFAELERNYEESHFWLNYGSACDDIGRHIKESAELVNQAANDHLEPADILIPVGTIIPMDFPNHCTGLIENIIKRSLDVHGKAAKRIQHSSN